MTVMDCLVNGRCWRIVFTYVKRNGQSLHSERVSLFTAPRPTCSWEVGCLIWKLRVNMACALRLVRMLLRDRTLRCPVLGER